MSNSETEFLRLFGWNEFFENQWISIDGLSEEAARLSGPLALKRARVIGEEKNLYRLQVDLEHSLWASLGGKLQYHALVRSDLPAVGDWVLVHVDASSDRGVIRHVFQRRTSLKRRQVGGQDDQILATNVDWAMIATAVVGDLNIRRLERYLSVVREAGSRPVILLTKADEAQEEIAEIEQKVRAEFKDVPVHRLSKDQFDQALYLQEYLAPGQTAVVLGSSGVGKSTLVRYLTERDEIKTQEVRDYDLKGRHTTTSRHLYPSRFGGLVIDTPGMRELQLSDHDEGLRSQFADIEELIGHCRFGDCRHDSEPGCAIKQALEDDVLSFERWQSYQKLDAEVRHAARKQDKALASEARKRWKKISNDAYERIRFKKRGWN